jgi:hypothetical protein
MPGNITTASIVAGSIVASPIKSIPRKRTPAGNADTRLGIAAACASGPLTANHLPNLISSTCHPLFYEGLLQRPRALKNGAVSITIDLRATD